jgi:hypothetical protein
MAARDGCIMRQRSDAVTQSDAHPRRDHGRITCSA